MYAGVFIDLPDALSSRIIAWPRATLSAGSRRRRGAAPPQARWYPNCWTPGRQDSGLDGSLHEDLAYLPLHAIRWDWSDPRRANGPRHQRIGMGAATAFYVINVLETVVLYAGSKATGGMGGVDPRRRGTVTHQE